MPYLSIAYVSVATNPRSDADVGVVLSEWRSKNLRDGITGALIFHRDRIIQIIEGPEDATRAKYDVIAADPRHRSVQKMREKTIPERQFPEWTMGYRAPSDEAVRQLDGFEDFFARRGVDRLKHAENEAQQFLEWLGEYWLPSA